MFRLGKSGRETVLLKFNGPDGEAPYAGLIRDKAGNLYGTTYYGARFGNVFRLAATGKETLLHDFDHSRRGDGEWPAAGLIRDTQGNLLSTTYHGGASNMGTVFRLDKTGKETVLHSFAGADGSYPYAGLIQDAAGNLYGTTTEGGGTGCGGGGCGVVFKLAP